MIDLLNTLQDLVNSGAWPFLVGEVICQVYSENERDSIPVKALMSMSEKCFFERLIVWSGMKASNNRSVMPFDVRGCTRVTIKVMPFVTGIETCYYVSLTRNS